MGSLWEGRAPFGNQVCRLVNGMANQRQRSDWRQFLYAQYFPCSSLRSALGKPDPPVTWEFSHPPNDPRYRANIAFPHFVEHFGFEFQTPGSLCWGTSLLIVCYAKSCPLTYPHSDLFGPRQAYYGGVGSWISSAAQRPVSSKIACTSANSAFR
jgi:hypothetical protein